MTVYTTTAPVVPHWDGPVWVIPIGGDCPYHGPHRNGCPGCAQLQVDATSAPVIHAGGAR